MKCIGKHRICNFGHKESLNPNNNKGPIVDDEVKQCRILNIAGNLSDNESTQVRIYNTVLFVFSLCNEESAFLVPGNKKKLTFSLNIRLGVITIPSKHNCQYNYLYRNFILRKQVSF